MNFFSLISDGLGGVGLVLFKLKIVKNKIKERSYIEYFLSNNNCKKNYQLMYNNYIAGDQISAKKNSKL